MTRSQLRRRLDLIEARLPPSQAEPTWIMTDEERLQAILRIWNRYRVFGSEITPEEIVAQAGANGYEQTAAGALRMVCDWREAQEQEGANNGKEETL